MSACYNASATLVVRDFVLRYKPETTESKQVVIGRWVTVLMAVLGVLAAPLVGLSVTIWYYLQLISHYLCAPMMAVILTGVLWKKANTKGAIGGIIAGFCVAAVVFLDQVLHLRLPILSLPVFTSFLHRDLVVLVVATVATVIVSNMTSEPEDLKRAVVNVSAEFTKPWEGIGDYRNAALVLFIFTDVLWYLFR
jgi:SSS family solute:Na+ symporter